MEITRREALVVIGAVAVFSLIPKRRIEPLVPQPHEEPIAHQYWNENMEETEGWFLYDLDNSGYPVFWDFPEWAEGYELIGGVWCWV